MGRQHAAKLAGHFRHLVEERWCIYCGAPATTKDHFLPLFGCGQIGRGGLGCPTQSQGACARVPSMQLHRRKAYFPQHRRKTPLYSASARAKVQTASRDARLVRKRVGRARICPPAKHHQQPRRSRLSARTVSMAKPSQQRPCETCQRPFTVRRYWARFCSTKCTRRAYRKRLKEEIARLRAQKT